MYSVPSSRSLATGCSDVILDALESGLRLSVKDGGLRCRTSRGADVREHIAAINMFGAECAALLMGSAANAMRDMSSEKNGRLDFAPLSLSQLTHWKFHELGTRFSTRTCGLALRFYGELDEEALNETIDFICLRHEVLRTRIVTISGKPVQCVYTSPAWARHFEDLTSTDAGGRRSEVNRLLVQYHTAPVRVSTDPLLAVVLIKLDANDHVVFIAMDHLISDGISANILLRELLSGYGRRQNGDVPSPAPLIQFADYAIWERKRYHEWAAARGANWSRHLDGLKALRMPSATAACISEVVGLQCVPIHLDSEATAALLHWTRTIGTTAAMAVFTAFAALVLRWYEVSEAAIHFQTHGRFVPEVQNSIGYFAFRRYLRIGLRSQDRLADFQRAVAAEYVSSLENETFPCAEVADASGELARNPCFNWLTRDQPNDTGVLARPLGAGLKCHRIRYEDTIEEIAGIRSDTDLLVALSEVGKEVHGAMRCPVGAMPIEIMERFVLNLLNFLRILMQDPETRVGQIVLL